MIYCGWAAVRTQACRHSTGPPNHQQLKRLALSAAHRAASRSSLPSPAEPGARTARFASRSVFVTRRWSCCTRPELERPGLGPRTKRGPAGATPASSVRGSGLGWLRPSGGVLGLAGLSLVSDLSLLHQMLWIQVAFHTSVFASSLSASFEILRYRGGPGRGERPASRGPGGRPTPRLGAVRVVRRCAESRSVHGVPSCIAW